MSVGQQGGDRVKRPGASGDDWGALREDVGGIAEAAVSQGRHFMIWAKDHATDYADKRKADIAQSVADLAASLRDPRARLKNDPTSRRLSTALQKGSINSPGRSVNAASPKFSATWKPWFDVDPRRSEWPRLR